MRAGLAACALVTAGLTLGCTITLGRPRSSAADPQPSGGSQATCGAGATVPKSFLKPGSVLLFGEIHGTQELPAFFAEAVCTVARSGRTVEVGLEIPRSDQAVLDAFLASQGTPADVEALTSTAFWSREYQDGRSSRGMLALLGRLRELSHAGLPVHVFAFDLDPAQQPPNRDAGMADNIALHARAHAQALTMVMVGEVHAWKVKGAPWNPEFVPMGFHLESVGLKVFSLGRATPDGTAWICTSPSVSDCGEASVKATSLTPRGEVPGMETLSEPSPRGYDGLFAIPAMTASPPATRSSPPS